MAFVSVENLLRAAGDMPLWEAVLTDDLRDRGGERDTSWEKMTRLWRAMVESVEGYDPARRSACNLTGGDARKVETRAVSLAGPVLTDIIATALKVGECNACMGRIVAAPTAGASGVLPAVLLPIRKKYDFSEEEMVKALYVSAASARSSPPAPPLPGRRAAVRRRSARPPPWPPLRWSPCWGARRSRWPPPAPPPSRTCWDWCATRWPDWWRSPVSSETSSARSTPSPAAELALAGVENVIPCDEVIDAMRAVGDVMPAALRETGGGGWPPPPPDGGSPRSCWARKAVARFPSFVVYCLRPQKGVAVYVYFPSLQFQRSGSGAEPAFLQRRAGPDAGAGKGGRRRLLQAGLSGGRRHRL